MIVIGAEPDEEEEALPELDPELPLDEVSPDEVPPDTDEPPELDPLDPPEEVAVAEVVNVTSDEGPIFVSSTV